MSDLKVSFRLDEEQGFISTVDGKEPINIKNSISDNRRNFSPTEFLLYGMAACSSDDVVNILTKMKEDLKTYSVEVQADRYPEPPKVLTHVHMKFMLNGNIKPEKVKKAINLSLSKYCSVSILARRGGTKITYEFSINGNSYGVEEPDEAVPA